MGTMPSVPGFRRGRSTKAAIHPPVLRVRSAVMTGWLEQSVRTLHAYLCKNLALSFQITIADNASDDGTLDVARMLANELEDVRVLYLDRKGRGHALRVAWMRSDADVLAYMDVDLSTDLSALGELVIPLLEGAETSRSGRVSQTARRSHVG